MVFVDKEKILATEHDVLEHLTMMSPADEQYSIGFLNGVVEMVSRLLEGESEAV